MKHKVLLLTIEEMPLPDARMFEGGWYSGRQYSKESLGKKGESLYHGAKPEFKKPTKKQAMDMALAMMENRLFVAKKK